MRIEKRKYKNNPTATVDFLIGQRGSGKSTLACKLLLKYKEKGYNVYSNTYLEGARKFRLEDLMVYDFGPYAVLWIDEGAVSGLATRGNQYKKSNTDNIIKFFQEFRRFKFEKVIITCPDFDDVIPAARNAAENIVYIQRSKLFGFIFCIPNFILRLTHKPTLDFSVCKYCGQVTDIIGGSDGKKIGRKKGQLQKVQYWKLGRSYFFLNRYRKYFTSFTQEKLTEREWSTWGKEIKDSDIPEVYNGPLYKPKFIDRLKKKIKEKMKGLKTLQRKNKKPDVEDS